MSEWNIVILSLATWRLAHMIVWEEGPGAILARWRGLMGVVESLNGIRTAKGNWGRMWLCPLCLSVWIAPMALLLFLGFDWFYWVALALAVSGGASLLELLTKQGRATWN